MIGWKNKIIANLYFKFCYQKINAFFRGNKGRHSRGRGGRRGAELGSGFHGFTRAIAGIGSDIDRAMHGETSITDAARIVRRNASIKLPNLQRTANGINSFSMSFPPRKSPIFASGREAVQALREQKLIYGVDTYRNQGIELSITDPDIPNEVAEQLRMQRLPCMLVLSRVGLSLSQLQHHAWSKGTGFELGVTKDQFTPQDQIFKHFTDQELDPQWEVVPMGADISLKCQDVDGTLDKCKTPNYRVCLPNTFSLVAGILLHNARTAVTLYSGYMVPALAGKLYTYVGCTNLNSGVVIHYQGELRDIQKPFIRMLAPVCAPTLRSPDSPPKRIGPQK